MRQWIAPLSLALFAVALQAFAEPTSQPTSKPTLPHILVESGGMLGSYKTDLSPEGVFVRTITLEHGTSVKTIRHTLTPWERQHVAKIALATVDAPSQASEVTDYVQEITIGTFYIRQHATDPRFAKLFDVLDRLEVQGRKEAH